MLNSVTFAMAAPGQGAGQGGSSIMAFLPMIALVLIFYFLIIRPQQKRQKEQKLMQESLQKGDKIITAFGLSGQIVNIDETKAVIKIAEVKGEAVKIEIAKSAISGKVD